MHLERNSVHIYLQFYLLNDIFYIRLYVYAVYCVSLGVHTGERAFLKFTTDFPGNQSVESIVCCASFPVLLWGGT